MRIPSTKGHVAILTAALGLAFSLSLLAEKKPWQKWSAKDAKKEIQKATQVAGGGFGELMGVAMVGGIAGGGKLRLVSATWLTDGVLRAVARNAQIQERLTDDEMMDVYHKLKGELEGYYAFYVSASSLWLFRGGAAAVADAQVDTDNPNRIFLQHAKNKDTFLRPVRIAKSGPELAAISSLAELPALDEDAILLFARDEEFMNRAKNGELELELIQEGKKRRMRFDIKKLVEHSSQL